MVTHARRHSLSQEDVELEYSFSSRIRFGRVRVTLASRVKTKREDTANAAVRAEWACKPQTTSLLGALLFVLLLHCSLFESSVCCAQTPAAAMPAPKLLEVAVPGGKFVGLPVHWSRFDAVVLEPSGQLQILDQSTVTSHRLLEHDFSPQTLVDARNSLQNDLGSRYETIVFGPYVIAAPVGQTERWRTRFSALLSGYLRYFEVRGWPLERPDFPLCVTVFATRQEFLAYSAAQVQQLPASIVGSYFPRSNRCVLYQIESFANEVDWSETEATIVHEAVHQLAYNTGIHERLSMDPLWFVEGLASMFEQPNVYDLRQQQSTIQSRMLLDKRQRLQPLLQQPDALAHALTNLIGNDDLFAQNPTLAYDLGWAMTFYMAERMPTEFRNYYTLLSQRKFGDYTEAERARDFRQVFGGDISLLAVQITRLFKE